MAETNTPDDHGSRSPGAEAFDLPEQLADTGLRLTGVDALPDARRLLGDREHDVVELWYNGGEPSIFAFRTHEPAHHTWSARLRPTLDGLEVRLSDFRSEIDALLVP